MKANITLKSISDKYCVKRYYNNYSIGGGLSEGKFASNRHEDAKSDEGKLTLGQATQLFKKATNLDIDLIKEVLKYAIPNMEWHHAGKLPKSYGGGMKKTYFLNATEICDCAQNWVDYIDKYNLSKQTLKNEAEKKRYIEAVKLQFLQNNAKKIERVEVKPNYFYQTAQEMNGKYGWFDSTYKSYQLPKYYSGWEFASQELLDKFKNIN